MPSPAARPANARLVPALALAALAAAAGCSEITSSGPDRTAAVVAVEGRVLDPSGAGVEDAGITITMHETSDCASSTLREATGPTGPDGRFGALVGLNDTGSDFQPREVCLDVRAEPPASRPELGAAERTGLGATLRRQDASQPGDTVEVELTLPETGAG